MNVYEIKRELLLIYCNKPDLLLRNNFFFFFFFLKIKMFEVHYSRPMQENAFMLYVVELLFSFSRVNQTFS